LIFIFPGEHRASSLTGNTRNSYERMRISSLGGTNDNDNMDNPSSREDISEMYVSRQHYVSCVCTNYNDYNENIMIFRYIMIICLYFLLEFY